MCDISKVSDIKKIVVYKLVIKEEFKNGNRKYYGVYSYFPTKVGKVNYRAAAKLSIDSQFYNENMVGRITGFKRFMDCKRLWDVGFYGGPEYAIVRLELEAIKGWPIMYGTGRNVSADKQIESAAVYAGAKVNSIKEVWNSDIEFEMNQAAAAEKYRLTLSKDRRRK
jgi:hypothetical protein